MYDATGIEERILAEDRNENEITVRLQLTRASVSRAGSQLPNVKCGVIKCTIGP